jgi:chromosome segregation ATPase
VVGAANIVMADAQGLAERHGADLAELKRVHAELETLADERRTAIAALETRVSGLEMRILDAEREASRATAIAADRSSALELAERERDFARNDLAQANNKRDQLQARIEEQAQQLEALEQTVRTAQRARNKLAQDMATKKRDLAEAAEREGELIARIDQQAQASEAAQRNFADGIEVLRSERNILQGTVDALRQERVGQAPRDTADTDLLRQAIVDVGAEVARLAAALEKAPGAETAAGGDLAERMRLLQARVGRGAMN